MSTTNTETTLNTQLEDAITLLCDSTWEGTISIRTLIDYKDEQLLEGKYTLKLNSSKTTEFKGEDTFEKETHEVSFTIYSEMNKIFVEFSSGENVSMNGIFNMKNKSISGMAKTFDGASGTFSIQMK
eukprot:gene12634-6538_t